MITIGSNSTPRLRGTKGKRLGLWNLHQRNKPRQLELMCLRSEGYPTATGAPGGPMEGGLNPLRRENSLATTVTSESAWWGWFWECGSWKLEQVSPPDDYCWGVGVTLLVSKPIGRQSPSLSSPHYPPPALSSSAPCWESLVGWGEVRFVSSQLHYHTVWRIGCHWELNDQHDGLLYEWDQFLILSEKHFRTGKHLSNMICSRKLVFFWPLR